MIRIMVVEDEPPILRNICRKITEAGPCWKIAATANNGEQAIAWLKWTASAAGRRPPGCNESQAAPDVC